MSYLEKALNKFVSNKVLDESAANSEEYVTKSKQSTMQPLTSETFYFNAEYSKTRLIPITDEHLLKNNILNKLTPISIIEQINMQRTQIMTLTEKHNYNTILITSPGQKEGKTLTALNLAISITRQIAKTAIFVDADMRFSSIENYLGIECEYGLSDYLTNKESLFEVMLNPGIPKLTLLPAGNRLDLDMVSEYIGSPNMKQLILTLKEQSPDRYIIIDGPPLLKYPDAQIISEFVDCIILVVASNLTRKQEINKAFDLLKGKNLIGLILNRI